MSALLARVTALLAARGIEHASAEAQQLCAAAGEGVTSREGAPAGGAAADREAAVLAMVERRVQGEPIAYIVGRQVFMGVELLAAPGALVPREETELLGAQALAAIGSLGVATPRVVDMCCGAGNLACAIARLCPAATVWAADLTDGCVSLARRNAQFIGAGDRLQVFQGDLFAALAGLGLEGTIDVIVCNPPYISQGRLATDRAVLLAHEPREAFDGGPYGLSIHQRVVREALPFLRPGGVLLFEIGLGQDRQVQLLFERAKLYEQIAPVANSTGDIRVVAARRRTA